MIPEPWLLAVLGIAPLGHLFVVAYVHLAGGTLGEYRDGGVGGDHPVRGGTVECSECDAENERGYRFCRSCVAELPGAVDRTRSAAVPTGRRIE